MSVRANFADIYLRGMSDRSIRSGTELAREIQLTDWSKAGEQGKLVFSRGYVHDGLVRIFMQIVTPA